MKDLLPLAIVGATLAAIALSSPAHGACIARSGWSVAGSANFCVYHLPGVSGVDAAADAERTRTAARERWFGDSTAGTWARPAEIFLQPTATTQANPGSSEVDPLYGNVTFRRAYLRVDSPTGARRFSRTR